jgi:hypothetical protein
MYLIDNFMAFSFKASNLIAALASDNNMDRVTVLNLQLRGQVTEEDIASICEGFKHLKKFSLFWPYDDHYHDMLMDNEGKAYRVLSLLPNSIEELGIPINLLGINELSFSFLKLSLPVIRNVEFLLEMDRSGRVKE